MCIRDSNIPFDITTYISESIHEVYKTLFEALFLVIFVVFLSLQSWRASLIPLVAVPVSLIGTFGFMLAFGFSLNMLCLLYTSQRQFYFKISLVFLRQETTGDYPV